MELNWALLLFVIVSNILRVAQNGHLHTLIQKGPITMNEFYCKPQSPLAAACTEVSLPSRLCVHVLTSRIFSQYLDDRHA